LIKEELIPLQLARSFGMMIRRGRSLERNDLLVQRVIELELEVGRMSLSPAPSAQWPNGSWQWRCFRSSYQQLSDVEV
jgi:hypothetical protein